MLSKFLAAPTMPEKPSLESILANPVTYKVAVALIITAIVMAAWKRPFIKWGMIGAGAMWVFFMFIKPAMG
jgi:hypothetical protein